jgi:cellulose synthase/poly-beta-1,6-N-acetylglucosamine synthase-like glycosyltransferase
MRAFIFLLYTLVIVALLGVSVVTLVWMVHSWRTPGHVKRSSFARMPGRSSVSFTLLVPARHEETVLERTLSRTAGLHHSRYTVIAIVGDDDAGTRDVAERVAARFPTRIRVVVDDSDPKSKPKALNAALPFVEGDIIGVFDAEDEVHPDLLANVEAEFRSTGADVVQAGVQLMNHDSSWYSVRNVLEYYFHFRSRMHLYAEKGLVPLGGNTVFVRTECVEAIGGWDPNCLAEDCDLGVRLSSAGARIAVCYEPDLATREETPSTLRAFFKQRTRWSQGFLQVLHKRDWRRLPTRRQRWLAVLVLSMPFLQALMGLALPFAVLTMLWLRVPAGIALLSFTPAVPLLAIVTIEAAALVEFGRQFHRRIRVRDHVRLVVGTVPFQAVLAAAALRAVAREARRKRGWEKTPHLGVHLRSEAVREAA